MGEGDRTTVEVRPSGVSLRCFPSDDVELAETVALVVASLGASLGSRDLEKRLRAAFPEARVVEQHPLASLGLDRMLYIFRDGGLRSSHSEGPGSALYRSDWVRVADTIEATLHLLTYSESVRAAAAKSRRRCAEIRRRIAAGHPRRAALATGDVQSIRVLQRQGEG